LAQEPPCPSVVMKAADRKKPSSIHALAIESGGYLEEHNISKILNEAVRLLLEKRPSDPLSFLIDLLSEARRLSGQEQRCEDGKPGSKPVKQASKEQNGMNKPEMEAALLAVAVGAKGAIGPALIEKHEAQSRSSSFSHALKELRKQLDSLQESDASAELTYFKKKLETADASNKGVLKRSEVLVSNCCTSFERLVPDLAARIAPELKRTEAAYWAELDAVMKREPQALQDLEAFAEKLNAGPFKAAGQDVHVVIAGRFDSKGRFTEDPALERSLHEAKVVDKNVKPDGKVLVDLFFEQPDFEEKYVGAFKARAAVDRKKIYGGQASPMQPLQSGVAPNSLEALFAVYTLAATTLPLLNKAVEAAVENAAKSLKRAGPDPDIELKTAPLKAYDRAAAKAAEKYNLRFDRLLDIARLTVVCGTLAELVAVVTGIHASSNMQVVRMKNRINPLFPADESAGYRDVLLNVLYKETKCICEVQVTLAGFVAIKNTGGHGAYKVGRVIGTDRKECTTHAGELTAEVVRRVGAGLIQRLQVEGTTIARSQLSVLPGRDCLSSAGVRLTALKLGACRGLTGFELLKLLSPEVCTALAGTLRVVDLTATGVTGRLADVKLAQHCKQLEVLMLGDCKLTGPIPAELGTLSRLKILKLYSNDLGGKIPEELGHLSQLQILELHCCLLEGKIPLALCRPQQLQVVSLSTNKLSGNIPADISSLSSIRELYLRENELTGQVPSKLLELPNIRQLWLSKNSLDGLESFKKKFLRQHPDGKCICSEADEEKYHDEEDDDDDEEDNASPRDTTPRGARAGRGSSRASDDDEDEAEDEEEEEEDE